MRVGSGLASGEGMGRAPRAFLWVPKRPLDLWLEVRGHRLMSPPCRLEALQACVVQLSEARAQQSRQLEELQAENAAQREAYRALLEQAAHQEAALRRLQEEARDLLERLVQRKARAAAECNLRNERRER